MRWERPSRRIVVRAEVVLRDPYAFPRVERYPEMVIISDYAYVDLVDQLEVGKIEMSFRWIYLLDEMIQLSWKNVDMTDDLDVTSFLGLAGSGKLKIQNLDGCSSAVRVSYVNNKTYV